MSHVKTVGADLTFQTFKDNVLSHSCEGTTPTQQPSPIPDRKNGSMNTYCLTTLQPSCPSPALSGLFQMAFSKTSLEISAAPLVTGTALPDYLGLC